MQADACPFEVQHRAVAALAELLAVLPAEVSEQYEAHRDWVVNLLSAPRPELRLQAAILYAQIYARTPLATVEAVLGPLSTLLAQE